MTRALLLALAAAAPAGHVLTSRNLSAPFGISGGWRLIVTQAPDEPDPIAGDDKVLGAVRACLTRDEGRTCQPDLLAALRQGSDPADAFAEPHELSRIAIVRASPAQTLLLVRLGSLHSGNGDQRMATMLLRYDRSGDRFVPTYRRVVGQNNNQEVRYIEAGRMRGAVIAAEPTTEAPFGFWMTVSRPGSDGQYRQTLRYRSATPYNDGNSLAVIDSEMPTIERRLGLWHRGQSLPHPTPCAMPRLVRMELWCAPAAAGRP